MSTTTPLEPDLTAISCRPRAAPAAAAGRRSSSLVVDVRRRRACSTLLLGWSPVAGAGARRSSCSWSRLPLWSRLVEGRRAAADRLATALVWTAFGVVAGAAGLADLGGGQERHRASSTCEFLTYDMRNVVGAGGGIYHALIGTLLVTLAADDHLGPDRAVHRDLPGGVRQGQPARPVDDLPGRRDDRHPVDRGRPLRAVAVRADLRAGDPDRLRRRGRAVAADDPDRGALDRGDAAAGARATCARRRTPWACRSGARSSRSCCRPRSAASSPASCSRSRA